MKAAWVEAGNLGLKERPLPRPPSGWALVRVACAGVCGTDLALHRGLYGFRGTPGHEFVGVVERGPVHWKGRRVGADINVACGRCRYCRGGAPNHCAARRVLGIRSLNGAFAEFLTVPARNLVAVPEGLDDDGAVFAEPLAAALDAQRQLPEYCPVLVVGPGRLGQLVIRVLLANGRRVFCLGRSSEALAYLPHGVVQADVLEPSWRAKFAAVVDCSGTASGIHAALDAVRPRGTLVLKGTSAAHHRIDLDRLVVDEIRLLGSRCGPMAMAVDWLRAGRIDPRPLISSRRSLNQIGSAFTEAAARGQMKVLVKP